MYQPDNIHPLEGLIADYLNGHLSDVNAKEFFTAMTQDSQLREMVEFERRIQASVTAEQPLPSCVPQFADIADQLDNRSSGLLSRWTMWGSSFAVAIVIAVVIGSLPQSEQPINEFETLSDGVIAYDQPVLRILYKEGLDEAALKILKVW